MSAVIVTSPGPAAQEEIAPPTNSEVVAPLLEMAREQGEQAAQAEQQAEQVTEIQQQQRSLQAESQYLENRLASLETNQTELRTMIQTLVQAWDEADEETNGDTETEIEVLETQPENSPAFSTAQPGRLWKAIFGTPRH